MIMIIIFLPEVKVLSSQYQFVLIILKKVVDFIKKDIIVLWDANANRNENESSGIILIRGILFNKQVQDSQRLYISLLLELGK